MKARVDNCEEHTTVFLNLKEKKNRKMKIEYADPKRFSSGHWNSELSKQIGEGDISKSYSADKIAEGTVRSPFKWKDGLRISIGAVYEAGCEGKNKVETFRLVPIEHFDGEPFSYAEATKSRGGKGAKPFYDGMKVKRGKSEFVLTDMILFIQRETKVEEKQLSLF